MNDDPAVLVAAGSSSHCGRVGAMSEIWEHARLTVDVDVETGFELHLYSTFPDTLEWAREAEAAGGEIGDIIDRLGRAGWQMVTMSDMNTSFDFFFKRQRT